MKNIHLLPTLKPSRLWINNLLQGKLEIEKEVLIGSNTAHHIYITSDEEIKDGEYYLSWQDYFSPPKFVVYVKSSGVNGDGKKIILTTDQDLISDGVQAIDDEFLKWFVKNPSCENVEVGYGFIRLTETDNEGYWVSIPNEQIEMQQEEPKQETIKAAMYILQNSTYGAMGKVCDEESKQETLEEAAERLFPDSSIQRRIFKKGAKWQEQKMYSEEEVYELLSKFHIVTDGTLKFQKEWFQQFKKK